MGKFFLGIVILLTCSHALRAQTISSAQDGSWNDPNTWSGGVIPTGANTTGIQVGHLVTIPSGYSVTVDGLAVSSQLTIATGGTLTFLSEATPGFVQNHIAGTLTRQNLSTLSGTTGNNLVFDAGSTYEHFFTTTEGNLPLAAWAPTSNLAIRGYTVFANATAVGNWSQNFGNVIWDCAAQTSVLNLNGRLTSVQGDFIIQNSNTGIVQFSTNQNPVISVGEDFSVLGTSRFYLSTTGGAPGVTLNVGGNFTYNSTQTSGSYVSTTGTGTVNITGNFSMQAGGGSLRLAGGTTGSGTLNINGNFTLVTGAINEVGSDPTQGNIQFTGANTTHTFSNSGTISQRINYIVPAGHSLRVLGESQLIGASLSSLTVSGTLILESTNSTGAIITGASTGLGNVRVGVRTFNAGSRIIYGGAAQQAMGNGQPSDAGVITEINNPAGVVIATTLVTINGDLTINSGNITVLNGSLTVAGNTALNGGNLFLITQTVARTLTLNGPLALGGGGISVASGTANATLVLGGTVSGEQYVHFNGANCVVTINGNGALGRSFPVSDPLSIEALTVNRTGGTVAFDQGLTTINLTVNAGALDMNAPLTVTNDVNLAAGTTLFIEDQTVEFQRFFNSTITGGVLSANGNTTLNIVGTSGVMGTLAFAPAGNTVGDFVLNRAGTGTTVVLNSPLTISNNLILTDGVFNNISGLSLADGANIVRNSNASFLNTSAAPLGGPYNLTLTGASMTTGAEATGSLNNVTCSAGTVTLSTNLNAVGDFTLTSGSFTCGTHNVSVRTLTNGAILSAPTTGVLALTGDFINNGTFNRNGTVAFNGVTSISGTTNPSFKNVVINGTLTAPATFPLVGSFTNNGIFVGGTGTVSFLGTAGVSQVISGTATTTFHHMSVTNTTASPDVLVEGSANLGGILTIATGATVDADGASGAGVFTVVSSNDNPVADGAIAALTAATQLTGNVTVQRFMSIEGGSNAPDYNNGRVYRYISSPVQNGTVADIQDEIPVTGNFDGKSSCTGCNRTTESMFLYDEAVITDINNSGSNTASDGYRPYPAYGSNNLVTFAPGRGYTIFVRGDIDPVLSAGNARWDLRGAINSGTIIFNTQMTFTSSGDVANDGWNLVGNPFPSTIDWNAATGWTKTGITNTIYMTDNGAFAGGPTVIATFNGTVGTNGGSRYIPIGQAFFVKADIAGFDFRATEAVKAPGASTTYFREAEPANVLRITLNMGQFRDETVIHYRNDATALFDEQADAHKMNNDLLNLSSMLPDGTRLAINSLPKIDCESPVKLVVSDVPAGVYSLSFSGQASFAQGVSVLLNDAFLNRTTTISGSQNYSFEVTGDPRSWGADRFSLNVVPGRSEALTLSAPATVCAGEDFAIQLDNSKKGYGYVVKLAGDTLASANGTGSELAVKVPSHRLGLGMRQLMVVGVKQARAGCTELRQESVVDIRVEEMQQATIQAEDENTLVSNYAEGNSWYLNGARVEGATGQYLDVHESGIYSLVVTSGNCTSTADQEFVINSAEDRAGSVHVYPNPVKRGGVLTVESTNPAIGEVSVANSVGVEVGRITLGLKNADRADKLYSGTFDLKQLPSGLYFVQVKEGNKIRVVKILSL